MPEEPDITQLVHQSVRDHGADADEPARRIACGENISDVLHTSVCARVTCPKCLDWQKKLLDAVFAPLSRH